MARVNGRHRLDVVETVLKLNGAGSAGTRGELEDRFLELARSAGLPEPLVNVGLHVARRRVEVDFHWPELALCVEVDGHGHSRPLTRAQDPTRDEILRAAGYEVLRFSGDDLERPSRVRSALKRAARPSPTRPLPLPRAGRHRTRGGS